MTAKKTATNKSIQSRVRGTPNYPYLYAPAAMNRFLKEIPKKPKPDFVDPALFKAWGFLNASDTKIASVLETLGFLDASRRPTQKYETYMQLGKGPAVLGREIKRVYDALFKTVKNPGNASLEELKSFFNTYGGGGEKTVLLQMQTFKNMAQNATFGDEDPLTPEETGEGGSSNNETPRTNGAAIHIDLHIHLPEEKTKADYDSILESIARHIYGKRA